MIPSERRKAIQQLLNVKSDGDFGPKTRAAFDALDIETDHESFYDESDHRVRASSFADKADVDAFKRCKRDGGSDQQCFKVGDNGVGCWGDDTYTGPPMCALPPEDMEEKWGSIAAARHKRVRVTTGDKTVECILADRMPRRANIRNGAGIDLNPAAGAALKLKPPFLVSASWDWA